MAHNAIQLSLSNEPFILIRSYVFFVFMMCMAHNAIQLSLSNEPFILIRSHVFFVFMMCLHENNKPTRVHLLLTKQLHQQFF